MSVVIISVVTLVLLVLLIAGLHKFQLSKTQENADNIVPLPPLDSKPFKPLRAQSGTPVPRDKMTAEITLAVYSEPVRRDTEPDTETGPDTENQVENTGDEPWISRAAQLKRSGELEAALSVCASAYPLWSAYQQATLIHRAKIKELQKRREDVEDELSALYQLAATAAFLHSYAKDLPDLSLAQLKLFNLQDLQNLEFPYLKIGFQELRLIKKNDIKLMLELWGKPESHQNPREFHSAAWVALVTSQNTLF